MVQMVKEFASGIYNLILGLFTTSKHLGRHAITIQYPKERWEVPERSRGMVVLLTDHETGKLNCTACLLCMKACPSGAIDIEIEKDEKGKRHLVEFKVDYHICCFCGLCEESCNFAAIKMATKYEFPAFDKEELVWDSKKLAEMGLDVPYEKPVRKKKVVKKPAAKKPVAPAAEEEKPAAKEAATANPEIKAPAETKPADVIPPEEKAPEAKPAEEKPAPEKAPEAEKAEETPEKKTDDSASGQGESDSKEDKSS